MIVCGSSVGTQNADDAQFCGAMPLLPRVGRAARGTDGRQRAAVGQAQSAASTRPSLKDRCTAFWFPWPARGRSASSRAGLSPSRCGIQNAGTVVDEIGIEIGGELARWANSVPPRLRLFPGAEALVKIEFSPPAASIPAAGQHAYTVTVRSTGNPATADMVAGVVEVEVHPALDASLTPRISRGRTDAVHQVAIVNQGNATTAVTLEVREPDLLVETSVEPNSMMLAPGSSGTAVVKVGARRTARPGQPLPFQVVVRSASAADRILEAAFEPQARSWLPRVAALAAALTLVAALSFVGLQVFGSNQPESTSTPTPTAVVVTSPSSPQTPSTTPGQVACNGDLQTALWGHLSLSQPTYVASQDFCITRLILYETTLGTGMANITMSDRTVYAIDLDNFDNLGVEGAGSGEREISLAGRVIGVGQGETLELDFSHCGSCGGLDVTFEAAVP